MCFFNGIDVPEPGLILKGQQKERAPSFIIYHHYHHQHMLPSPRAVAATPYSSHPASSASKLPAGNPLEVAVSPLPQTTGSCWHLDSEPGVNLVLLLPLSG